MPTRKFEYHDDKSAKFWHVSLKGKTHTVTYGRIGTNGQEKTKSFDSHDKAIADVEKLIRQKTLKGYVEIGSKKRSATTAPRGSAKKNTKKRSPKRTPRIRFEHSWETLKTSNLRRASYPLDIPKEYFEFLKKANGGDPDHNIFHWQHPKKGRQQSYLERLVGIDPLPLTHECRRQAPDVVSATLMYRDELPKLSVVIGWADVGEVLLMFSEGHSLRD